MPREKTRILLAGFGNVGRTLLYLLYSGRYKWASSIIVAGVCDSRGCAVKADGFNGEEAARLLDAPRGGLSETPWGVKTSVEDLLGEVDVEIVVDARPSLYESPHMDIYRLQGEKGYHIVTANKAPLAIRPELITENPLREKIHYRATFMAGTPLFDLLVYGSAGRRILGIRGVFNTTTTYMLTLAEKGYSFEEALRKAVEAGVAEPDPSIDVECVDPAAKTAIIASTLGHALRLGEVKRSGLRNSWSTGGFVRCVSSIRVEDNAVEAEVAPQAVGRDDPLRLAVGKNNVAVIEYGDGGRVVLSGSGGGPVATSTIMISDIYKALRGLW